MDSINNACKLGGDAWLELQAFKTRQMNRREKLNRHKNLHKDLINGITGQQPAQNQASSSSAASTSTSLENASCNSPTTNQNPNSTRTQISQLSSVNSLTSNIDTAPPSGANLTTGQSNCNLGDLTYSINGICNYNNLNDKTYESPTLTTSETNDEALSNQPSIDQTINLELVECILLVKLCDVALKLPIDSRSLQRSICKIRALDNTPLALIENLLQKFAHQELITIEETALAIASRRKKQLVGDDQEDEESCIYVKSADHTKLVEFNRSFDSREDIQALLLESKSDDASEDHDSVPIQSIRSSTSSNTTTSSQLPEKDENAAKDNSEGQKDTRFQSDNKDLKSLELKTTMVQTKTANNEGTKTQKRQPGDDLESLLSLSSTKERESKKLGEELLELLSKPTAKERNLLERFRSADGYQVQEFCPKGTKGECNRNNNGAGHCDKLHFKKIIAKHTEESLGDCSFLNTCFHMDSCKYVHYEVDYGGKPSQQHQFKRPNPAEPMQKQRKDNLDITSSIKNNIKDSNKSSISKLDLATASSSSDSFQYKLSPEEQARIDAKNRKRFKTVLYPPQWIQCDLRFFDMSLLGKFSVVMADPPWDIHMELPYGTMSDDEMRKLNIPALQDEGVIFLWVTGRAMELGRECLALWGYERCDEIIWVKTNQLQRIIRTGRTGHWLNHGKEHCLVGVKGKPKCMNRGLDCDVIVAEVRATSHKPDEIYGIIERLSPGTRKIELFGRAHNVQPNWITLGNQLNGVRLIEPNLISAFKKLNLPFQTAEE